MINLEDTFVMNMENAIRGARNPMDSWERGDTSKCGVNVNCLDCPIGVNDEGECVCEQYEMFDGFPVIVGPNDLSLARKLCKAGSDHRKFMRQILVSVDILAPLYWWKEYDTYKIGTVANSTSTMHKIHTRPFAIEQFSTDQMTDATKETLGGVVDYLEELRLKFLETKDKQVWYDIIQLLPSSYNQLRTCTLNYEVLINIYHNRKNHKLEEWHEVCKWIESLPYAKELICEVK